MVVICYVVQSDKEKVTDELANFVLMNTLGGDHFSDLQNLRVSNQFDFLYRYKEGINQNVANTKVIIEKDTNDANEIKVVVLLKRYKYLA